MKTITKLMITAALTAGFASAPAMAGPADMVKDQAKTEMKKQARKQMKKQAVDKAVTMTGTSESTASTVVDGAEKAMEMTGVIDAAPKSDGSMMDKAVGMAKDGMKMQEGASHDTSDSMSMTNKVKNKMHYMDQDTVIQKMAPAATAPAASALPPVSCPAGTTGQPDGTCMITGDFNPS